MGANTSNPRTLDPKKIIGSTANQNLQNAIIASIKIQDPAERKQLVKNAAGGDPELEKVFMKMLENDGKIVPIQNNRHGLSDDTIAWIQQQISSLTSLDGLKTFITTLCGIINGRMEAGNQVAAFFDGDRAIGDISFKKIGKGNYMGLNDIHLRHCSAGEGNDCLLQAFLTDTCPDFCRMTQQTKNRVGSIFRRVVLPLIPRFSTLPNNLAATQLISREPLGDEVAAELAQQFQVNIGLFLHLSNADTLRYPYMTYAVDPIQMDRVGRFIHAPEPYPVFLDRPTIIIFNWGGGHYSSVCRYDNFDKKKDNYLFSTQETLSACNVMARNRTQKGLVCDVEPIIEPNYRVVPDPRANQFVAHQQMAQPQPKTVNEVSSLTNEQISRIDMHEFKWPPNKQDVYFAVAVRRSTMNHSADQHNANFNHAVEASLGPQELPPEVKAQFELASGLLSSIGREMIKTNADGNCFFWAVEGYGQIKGRPELQGIQQLRNTVAEELGKEQYKSSFTSSSSSKNVNQRTLEQHRIDIRVFETNRPVPSESWADHTDIVALANHFKVCIRIFDFTGEEIVKINIPERCKDHNAIEMVRVRKHYQLVMSTDDPHYRELQASVFDQGIPISLPLSASGLDLKKYHPERIKNTHNQSAPRDNSWECIQCTFSNPRDSRTCSMCGAAKGPAAASSSFISFERNANQAGKSVSMLSLGPLGEHAASSSGVIRSASSLPPEYARDAAINLSEIELNRSNRSSALAQNAANALSSGSSALAQNAANALSRVSLHSASKPTPYYDRLVKLRKQYNSITDPDLDEILEGILSIERSNGINQTSKRYNEIEQLFKALLNAYTMEPSKVDKIKGSIYKRLLKEMDGGGTRKRKTCRRKTCRRKIHKKLRKTHQRKTRQKQNKNKSRRRL